MCSLLILLVIWMQLYFIGGGLLAAPMVFVFPALMYRQAILHNYEDSTWAQRNESMLALVLMVLGTALGLVGSWQALQDD